MEKKNWWCPCRIGLICGVLALVSAFLVHAAVDTLSTIGWAGLLIGAPIGLGLSLRGCIQEPDVDLRERTVAHTGVACSVLSLVVFVV